jgi:protein gp37
MAQNSTIEWTNDTWNPWQGCKKLSPGCKFCYMYRDKKRYGQDPREVVRSKPPTFNAPLTKLKGPLVFTCSWSDFFIEEADPWRDEAWDIIRQTPHLTYQILTKRTSKIRARLPKGWGSGWPNVWLGVSVENDLYLRRIKELYEIEAKVRFVSYEPALGPLHLGVEFMLGMVDWLIAGGESGPNARPMAPNWARSIRDQCVDAGVPFFFKQWGGVNKASAGRLLDGREWNEVPELLSEVQTQPELFAL